MPVLTKDVDVNPAVLLDSAGGKSRDERWFALYAKPRQEKVLMRRLLTAGKSFCGLLVPNRGKMSSAGRTETSWFPGYVFLFGTDEDRYDAGCSGAVMQAIEVFDGESLRTDLRQIHSAISRGVHVARADQFIDDGQRVRVVSGPLAGQTGVLLYRKGTCRLVLSLTFIRQGAVIEMDRCMVEAA